MRPKKYLQIVWIEWLKLSTHKTIISKTKTSDSYTPIVAGRGGVGVCMTRWSGLDGGSHQPHDPAHDKCVWCLDIITAQTLHWCNDCSPDTDIVYTTPNTILLSSWCGLSPEKRREKYGCWMMIIHWYLHIGTCHMCYIFSYSCNIILQICIIQCNRTPDMPSIQLSHDDNVWMPMLDKRWHTARRGSGAHGQQSAVSITI